MNSVSGLMREYFSVGARSVLKESLPAALPISPKKSKWRMTTGDDALIRTFEFDSERQLRIFVNEVLAYQQSVQHHAQILIEGKVVKIRVTTAALNRVTELDTEYAARTEEMYEDLQELTEHGGE